MLLTIIATAVATYMLQHSKLFERPRTWLHKKLERHPTELYFVQCSLCLGTWIGLLFMILLAAFPTYAPYFFGALAAGGASYYFYLLSTLMGD